MDPTTTSEVAPYGSYAQRTKVPMDTPLGVLPIQIPVRYVVPVIFCHCFSFVTAVGRVVAEELSSFGHATVAEALVEGLTHVGYATRSKPSMGLTHLFWSAPLVKPWQQHAKLSLNWVVAGKVPALGKI